MENQCKYCKESERSRVESVTISYHYVNPHAYGYPEPVNWKYNYKSNYCPICGRKFEEIK